MTFIDSACLRYATPLAVVFCGLAIVGPVQAYGPQTEAFTTTLLSGDQADVYYPTHPHYRRQTFPVIAFLQGALSDKGLYSEYADRLAGHGYIVVVPNHFEALIPGLPPQLFSTQTVVTDVLASMVAANNDSSSPLYTIVDTHTLGVGGHSFGGAVGLYAVEGSCNPPFCFTSYTRPPELKAAALYGTNSIGLDGQPLDVDTSAAPVFLLQGSVDGIATPGEAASTFPLLEAPKGIIAFTGLNHWGIADVQNPPGTTSDPLAQTVRQNVGLIRLARWSAIVFDAYLKNDRRALRRLRREPQRRAVQVTLVE